jgi:hypothetical protein
MVLITAVILAVTSEAFAVDRVSVEEVRVNGYLADTISPGSSVTLTFRWENNTFLAIKQYTNTLMLRSPDGGSWDNITGQYLPAWESATEFLDHGVLYSTPWGGDISFYGFAISESGVPAGTSTLAWQMSFDVPDDPFVYGTTICVDTVSPAYNTWSWNSGSTPIYPEWDGPYCWQVLALNPDSCCEGRTGDVDMAGTYPEELDSTDLGKLVLYLFSDPGTVTLPCEAEADVDASGGTYPVDSSDLGTLVNFLFSPPGAVVLPDCP